MKGNKTLLSLIVFISTAFFIFSIYSVRAVPGGGGTTHLVGTLELSLRGENADIMIYQGGILLYSESNLAKDTVHSWFKLPIGTYKIRALGVTTGDVVEKDITITENKITEVTVNIGESEFPILWVIVIAAMGTAVCVFYISLLFKKKKVKKQ
ncbi:MAG: hypothetical protein IMZ52_01210 [Actinobacteria bacterium]|nr:hypothetical protein [Bacteroidota bacterium]MBE3093620.1 hypothetical protein [Actinomycetota bacterium]